MPVRFKDFMPRSIFGRSLVILVTPILLVQAITVFAFFDRHWEKMASRLAYAVSGEIMLIASAIEQGSGYSDFSEVSGYAARTLELHAVFSQNATLPQREIEGRGISWRRDFVRAVLTREMKKQTQKEFRVAVDTSQKQVYVSLQLENGVLFVTIPQRRLFSSSGYVVLVWMAGSSIILLAIAIIFLRNQIRPIRRLAVVAERFGKGLEIPTSFKPEGAREVRQASQAFLDMHDRIKRQISQRTAMLSGVSHDLRTPLTRMKLQLAMMPEGQDAEALKSDVADMERMINAYLDFAKGESGEQAVRADLALLIDRVSESFRRGGAKIDITTAGDLSFPMKSLSFERCLSNLVGNAIKYANSVWINARRNVEESRIEIMIDDDGPGIPEAMREEVFKPFVRVEPSRNLSTGGVGLGLPIAQDVVHGHGGKIWLERSPRGGLRVIIHIPV